MPCAEAVGTEVARGDQRTCTYYIKQCTVDENCKGSKWNRKRWGYTREAAVLNFREHIWNKHGIIKPEEVNACCARLEFDCYIGRDRVGELLIPTAKRTRTEPADEPPDEPPADEPAASEPDEDTVDINRVHTAAMTHAQEQIEGSLVHAQQIVRKARLQIKFTDELIDHLEAAGATLTNIVEQSLGNGD